MNQSTDPMRSRILTITVLLIALSALMAAHWLSGQPKTPLTIQAMVSTSDGIRVPASGIRFDVLNRSARALIDSISRLDMVRPPNGIIRALEDQNREMFLRGAIERRGFVLSRPVQQQLKEIAQIRRMYLDHLNRFPRYGILVEAVRRIIGPMVELDEQRQRAAPLPAVLKREVELFDPSREALQDEDGPQPEARTYALHHNWRQAVEAYDQGYHRDLVERAIVAAAVFREAAIVSAETDSLGQATFPEVLIGSYWISGHYPQDLYTLSRAHRNLIARHRADLPPTSRMIAWDYRMTLTAMSSPLTLTEADAIPIEINLPR